MSRNQWHAENESARVHDLPVLKQGLPNNANRKKKAVLQMLYPVVLSPGDVDNRGVWWIVNSEWDITGGGGH